MVHATEHNSLTGSTSRGIDLKFFGLALDLVNCGSAIKSLEYAFGECTFTAARRSIKKHVRKVIAFSEFLQDLVLFGVDKFGIVQIERAVLFNPQLLFRHYLRD